ncbi:MAG: tRNA (N6-isopentenyl adenosine(37)-C2)-methylthiotransferase MiaB [Planctomycetaceae bacterium]|nr:tRNA (N6-isopentenyl adenosine(37)-C2)-methylthiotransferase MiaB [Planctomycetaceae bacterium]
MTRKFYIETVGCQMNVLDSELAMSGLIEAGYEPVSGKCHADIVLFNTCSVRQHAEDKVYSALGRLRNWKDDKPNAILGVMGCMAQKDKDGIFKRVPHVDLVLGPGQLKQLPELIRSLERERAKRLEISLDRVYGEHKAVRESFRQFDPQRLLRARSNPYQAMVRIMFGCDKFCSYCIVPSVRGPEQSRPPHEIEAEIRRLADQGCIEVTLIGQTVNSYRYKEGGRTWHLQDLFAMIEAIDGIRRIRFVTSYPRGMTDELLRSVRDIPKVMPFLHVPAQSGSNDVLKRMKRNYTVEEYRDLLDRINATIPGVSVTSDFIVGFCGETDDEFHQTADLVRYGRFKNSFIFKYSVRPGTKASGLYTDDVPETAKKRRNNELLRLQNAISLELNETMVGQTVEILVEGTSKSAAKQRSHIEKTGNSELLQIEMPSKDKSLPPNASPLSDAPLSNDMVQLTGHTPCDRIVVFDGPLSLVGQIVPVKIRQAAPFTLFG